MKSLAPLVAVTGSLPLGGSSTFLVNFARAMRRRGMMLPIVVLDAQNAYAEDFKAIDNPIHCLTNRKLIYEDRLLWSYQQAAQYQPRAVLSCLSPQSFEILRVVPTGVLRMSIVQSDDPGPYAAAATYGQWTDIAIGVSKQIAAHLRRQPELQRARIEVIPYGIDFAAPIVRDPRAPNAPLRVIYLGRLVEEQKRISRITQLAKLLAARAAHVEFTIVGDGPQREQLRADLRSCPIVRFLDSVPYGQVATLLGAQDIYVLLSDFEGLPLSLLEAMGCGVVPIVSDLASGISDVVDESRGFRAPVGNVERAAEIIMELIHDRTKLRQCSENATDFARKHYSADTMAERFLGVIESAAARNEVHWAPNVEIPMPLTVAHRWMFDGVMRSARRQVKKFLG